MQNRALGLPIRETRVDRLDYLSRVELRFNDNVPLQWLTQWRCYLEVNFAISISPLQLTRSGGMIPTP
jgi:hypothetical protein